MGDVRKRLADNLKRTRREAGLSQEEFAFRVGLHRTYIADLERAARNPTIEVVEKIASALSLKLGDLLD